MSVNNNPRLPQHLANQWGWFVTLGVLLLIIGFVAIMYEFWASVAAAYYIGFMMLFGGIVQLVHAFSVKSWGRFFLWLIAGILYTGGGLICFFDPLVALTVFTFMLGFFLIVAGVSRIIIGFQSREFKGWGWVVTAGVITALAGLVIMVGWPINSIWVLGLFLAIDLMFQGWGWVAFGLGLKAIRG